MPEAESSPQRPPIPDSISPSLRRRRLLLILLVVAALLLAAAAWALAGLGRWLVVEDRLEPARAIVVLSGGMPYRAMEAAQLYRQGWAAEIWLTHPVGIEEVMSQLSIPYVGEEGYNRMVLERLGVPAQSIRLLADPIVNTEEEIRAVAGELRRTGGDRVVLVTSMPHTRRARTIWRRLVGSRPQAIVRYARADSFDAAHWWRNTRDALDVVRETLGLANAWAGFPVRPWNR
jgi:uncharacterized SAM-binding protein YcdF (DUF218 family)